MTESKNETYMFWLIVTKKNGKKFSVWKNLELPIELSIILNTAQKNFCSNSYIFG